MKGQYFIIKPDVYPFDVMVSIDETDDVLLKRLLRYGNTKKDCKGLFNMCALSRGRCHIFKDSAQTVIRLKLQPKKVDMIALISHEVFHAVSFILDRIGMKLDLYSSDEAYAYLTEYLMLEICKKLKM